MIIIFNIELTMSTFSIKLALQEISQFETFKNISSASERERKIF